MVALKDALSDLSDVCSTLNDESDRVADLISEVEDGINAAAPGFEVWCEGEHVTILSDAGEREEFWEIGFGRCAGAWRILAQRVRLKKYDELNPEADRKAQIIDQPRPLADCRRDVRVDAAPQLEELVRRISEEAARKTDLARKATDLAMARSKD